MDNITEILLGAIRAQVCGDEYIINRVISDEEMEKLYFLSKSQDMAHIVCAELDKQGLLKDNEIGAKFRKQMMLSIFRYERINYELEQVCRVLEAAKIPHIPLKGAVMRKYYPEPWMRTSSDIDILVKPENIDGASNALSVSLNYTQKGSTPHDISLFSPSGVHLELHFDTVEERRANNSKNILDNIWDYAVSNGNGNYTYELCDEMFYFYHIAHMAKHFEASGCGLRFFLDMWLLNRDKSNIEKRNKLLEDGKLLKFAVSSEELSSVWFSKTAHSSVSKCMEEYILRGGIYGSADNNITTQRIHTGSKLKYTLGLIFLSYDKMRIRYPSLNKKLLLPFYQVRRWFSLIFRGKTKRSINTLKRGTSLSQEQKDSVASMLKELGLISL